MLLVISIVVKWSLQILARLASKVHLLKLREDLGSLCDNTSDLDQGIQMHLSEISKLVLNRKVLNSDEDFVVNLIIIRIYFAHNVRSDMVDNVKHEFRLFC